MNRNRAILSGSLAAATVISNLVGIGTVKSANADGTPVNYTDMTDDSVQKVIWQSSHFKFGDMAMANGIAQMQRTAWTVRPNTDGDLRVYEVHNSDVDWFGREYCSAYSNTTGLCDYEHVELNATTMTAYGYNEDAPWKSLGCHEFAHSMGEAERYPSNDPNADSCVYAYIEDQSPTTSFEGSDINFINQLPR